MKPRRLHSATILSMVTTSGVLIWPRIVDCSTAMPIYEYRRPDGTTFEVMQKFSDPTLTEDPETGEPVTRVLSAPAIHFKGSGFHNTDYGTRKRNREKESSKDSKDSSPSKDSGSGSSSDSSSSSSSDSSSSTKSDSSSSSSSSASSSSSSD